MINLVMATALAALLGATTYSAGAQTAQSPLPQPSAESEDNGDAGPEMAERGRHGDRNGHRGWHRMRGDHAQGNFARHGGQGRMARMVDANGDNIIGDSEAAMLADRSFQRLDRDANGDLDESEFTTVRKRGGWWRWSQAQTDGISEGLKAKFTALDSDKNSKVSKVEYMAEAQTRFSAADSNKDGKVSPWEFYSQN